MDSEELARIFDQGEHITPYPDLTKTRRPGGEVCRVNMDFPAWMVDSLDVESAHLGVTRQSLIKTRIAERLGQTISLAPNGSSK